MTTQEIIERCKARGCRIHWTSNDGAPPCEEWDLDPLPGGASPPDGPFIDVDHCTTTHTGSGVFVYRIFPGEIVLAADGKRYEWSAEQVASVSAWVDQLHRMPLEEIP